MRVLLNLRNKALNLWNIGDDEVADPYLILPHGYGITKKGKLPRSAKRVLDKTMELMSNFPRARCVIFDSNYFKVPKKFEGTSEQYECELKKEYLAKKWGYDFRRIEFATDSDRSICSTVQEIDFANGLYDLKNLEVVSICDRIHARRVRYIWKKLTLNLKMKIDYKVVGVDGIWKGSLPSFWQKSNARWLMANIIGCVSYSVFGVSRMARVTHKVQ